MRFTIDDVVSNRTAASEEDLMKVLNASAEKALLAGLDHSMLSIEAEAQLKAAFRAAYEMGYRDGNYAGLQGMP